MTLSLKSLYSGVARKRWASLVLGAALVLAFAPYSEALVAPFALACLILLWDSSTPRQAGWQGFCFGLGLFTAGTYWLYISLNILGGLWPPMAVLLMLSLIVALAAYVALTGYLSVYLTPQGGAMRWLVGVPAVWTLTEWLRGWLFTGFPWMSVGYSQVDTPLGSLAPLAGVYGVSWATLIAAGLLVSLVQGSIALRVFSVVTGAGAVVALMTIQGTVWTEEVPKPMRVSLVQGAVPQELKWKPQQLQPTLDLYTRMTLEQDRRDLIVWPEAAIPALPFEIPEFLADLRAAMVERDTQLLTGILTYDIDRGEYRNTLLAIGPDDHQYHKRHLVAFGEFFPLPDFALSLLRIMNLPSESISSGEDDQPLLIAKGVPVAATICYEIAFGAEQLQFFPSAELMVNVSNDAWFGDSIAPHQHLQIGQMRALETGRYLLRATNTGITAVVDPRGRVQASMPQFEPGVVNAEVHPYRGATPYVMVGNWPVIGGALALTLLAGFVSRRQTPGEAP